MWRSRSEVEREVDDEIRFHIDMRTEANVAAGMDRRAARRDAKRRFGDRKRRISGFPWGSARGSASRRRCCSPATSREFSTASASTTRRPTQRSSASSSPLRRWRASCRRDERHPWIRPTPCARTSLDFSTGGVARARVRACEDKARAGYAPALQMILANSSHTSPSHHLRAAALVEGATNSRVGPNERS